MEVPENTLTRADIVDRLVQKVGLTKQDSSNFLERVLELVCVGTRTGRCRREVRAFRQFRGAPEKGTRRSQSQDRRRGPDLGKTGGVVQAFSASCGRGWRPRRPPGETDDQNIAGCIGAGVGFRVLRTPVTNPPKRSARLARPPRNLASRPMCCASGKPSSTISRPMKRPDGRRFYRPDDMELLRRLQNLLHVQGLTIRGAVKALDGDDWRTAGGGCWCRREWG
jgi:hypothetical protein